MRYSKNEIKAFIMGYYVDNNGNIYGPKGYQLKKNINNCGYYCFKIRLNNKIIPISYHRYVAFFKYGNKIYSNNMEVRHLNGNKLDNSYNNICIGTHSDNMRDIQINIRMKNAINATSYITKYSKELVKEIKEFHLIYNKYSDTMKKFNISSKGTLHYILNYRLE